jgi:2-polyprenyl-3-methyl-5-hydroxy-6-metoxy-1,4-benzoquinol methylase
LSTDNTKEQQGNKAHWDEIAPIHLKSYGIEGLLGRKSRIDEIEKRELYPVTGKEIIHLQCHIGTDTLSLALDGARVTGVDFSDKSIEIARELAERLKLDVEFLAANVLDLQTIVSKKFDIVYTSKGVLCWISDIDKWAETIAFLLKEGGVFYILEIHPLAAMYDDAAGDDLRIKYSYFHQSEPIHFEDDHADYSDGSYIPKNKTYEWAWPLSDIVNALIRHGLAIEFIHEHDKLFFKAFPGMAETGDGWWTLEKHKGMVPLTFSLRAKKGKS